MTCGKSGEACQACPSRTLCSSEQTCAVDPESVWLVQPTAATIAPMNGTQEWDLSSAPDVFIQLWCPANALIESSRTNVAQDSLTPYWFTGGCVAKAKDLFSTGFAISANDEDAVSHDVIEGKTSIALTQEQLLKGSVVVPSLGMMQAFTVQFLKQ
jgi:hypothetical protein